MIRYPNPLQAPPPGVSLPERYRPLTQVPLLGQAPKGSTQHDPSLSSPSSPASGANSTSNSTDANDLSNTSNQKANSTSAGVVPSPNPSSASSAGSIDGSNNVASIPSSPVPTTLPESTSSDDPTRLDPKLEITDSGNPQNDSLSTDTNSHGLSSGAIAGAVVVSIALILIIIAVGMIIKKVRASRKRQWKI
ncbi:hypothetical protein O181_041526 [Austropuccinia psidii MF-1]|uniref:Uncharacterized protein n=1 Tax=Austropuccinia psidii MF-1 TaxID=1389203 RepID=A0A9Q3DD78_9BASI|nr:hypothetical protein [Austropuccinia psidii MF-1]